jgi:fused signal recognition particle receptor
MAQSQVWETAVVLELLLIAIGILVVAALGAGAYLLGPRGKRRKMLPESRPKAGVDLLPPPPELEEREDVEPQVGDDAEVPRDTPTRTVETVELPTELVPPPVETPEPAAGRLSRLRARLARSQSTLGRSLLGLLSRDTLDEEAWEEVEDTLLTADVGVAPTQELVERLRTRVKVSGTRSTDEARTMLREELLTLVGTEADRGLRTARHDDGRPAVVLVVGVNGTGKTTTVGKLARVLVADGRTVLLGAADTFRAAAADQLETWGQRVGASTVRGPEGGDPASVAFDAVREGREQGVDTVVVDTAGRLQNKAGLMDELGKVKRVIEKHGPVDEVLLVLDATTGQNGLIQARVFAEVVAVTGIVLTKLDGTAKGGIVVAVQRELGVPVKLVGLGEGPDDLAPFDPEAFVDALLG